MQTYFWTVPSELIPKLSDETAQAVTDFLTGQGFTVGDVAVVGSPYRIRIDATTDPLATMNTWAGKVSNRRDQLERAKQLADAFKEKVQANQPVTNNEAAKALAAIILVVQRGGFDA